MKQWIKLGAVVLALAVAGCQTARGRHEASAPPEQTRPLSKPMPGVVIPGEPTPVAPSATQPSTSPSGDTTFPAPPLPEKVLPNYPKSADAISGAAVLSLLRSAQSARAAGQYGQAAGSLERALRIEPRNYFVWSTLADTYLRQKNYDQAESVAQKSNSLGRGNVYVEQENWRVIRDARNANGNAAGAAEAQARMDAIQQLLQPAVPQ
jgi:predicted Zn-dependent protease